MKTNTLFQKWTAIVVVVICSAFSHEATYDCKAYLPEKEGTVLTYETLNHKEKLMSTHSLTVISIKEEGDTVFFNVGMKQNDKKGNETVDLEMEMKCADNKFFFDMESMIPAQAKEMLSQQQVQMEIDSDFLTLPSKLSEGMELDDGAMTMSLKMGGNVIASMSVEQYNRHVEAKETISVPAGTFQCWKISSDIRTKVFGKEASTSSSDWYKVGTGLIKSESYDKKGNLETLQQLTKLTK